MALKPANLSARIKQAFRSDPAQAVQSLKEIIAEVLTLVETHVPEFDITPYRANFTRIRPGLGCSSARTLFDRYGFIMMCV